MKKNEGIIDGFVRLFVSIILIRIAVNKTVTGH
jgi:hypothetical protein